MRPDGGLADGHGLWSPSTESVVVYKEDESSVRITINEDRGPLPAVAVDALKPYAEILLEPLTRGDQTWTAPYDSDWVIAIGDFKP